jgi:hypothetical protein
MLDTVERAKCPLKKCPERNGLTQRALRKRTEVTEKRDGLVSKEWRKAGGSSVEAASNVFLLG